MTTSAPPPPAPPVSLQPSSVGASRLARIANMDRGALRELLAERGALIDAVLDARGVPPDARDVAVTQVVRDVWGEAALLSQPAPEERAFVIAHALAAVPVSSLEGTELDAAFVTHLCARAAAGLAPQSERALLSAQRQDPRVDAAARDLEAACARVAGVGAGAGRASALWAAIEASLK